MDGDAHLIALRSTTREFEMPVARLTNVVYLGRADAYDGNYFYYVGQAKDPGRRWEQHLRQNTGPCPFGDEVQWAILAWGVPSERLNAAESYLIGYILCDLGCVNGNRGNDEAAFVQGYLDANSGKPPAICPKIDLNSLDWQIFYVGPGDVIGTNRIPSPSTNSDVCERRWGFHKLDKTEIAESFLSFEKRRLEIETNRVRELRRKLEDQTAARYLWLMLGGVIGAILTFLGSKK